MTEQPIIPSRTALDPRLPWPFDRGESETETFEQMADRIGESPL